MFFRPGPNGGVDIHNMSLKDLIGFAYRVQPYQISGGPAWIDSARFDIVAKPETKATEDERLLMLQSLFEERFQLRIHRETKEIPVYALVLARKDGKLGPALKPSQQTNCAPPDSSRAPDPSRPSVIMRAGPGPDGPAPAPSDGPRLAGTSDPSPPAVPGVRAMPFMGCGQMAAGPGQLAGIGVPVARIAEPLSRMLGRPVLDKTGLAGNFDIQLQWTPDENQLGQMMGPVPGGPVPQAQDPNGPSIFTAVQEQLGLKLEAQKGSADTIVIDRAERPSEN